MARKSLMHKKLICLAVLSGLAAVTATSACTRGAGLEKAYNINNFDMDSVYNDGSLRAEPFAAALCVPDFDGDMDAEGVDAEGFLLFNTDTGEVISAHNIYERLYPASTTKIMTCLLALKYGDLTDTVIVPEESEITEAGSSMADLAPGDKINLGDLLYGLMVPSGNDAAVAVACHISGSTEAFVELMNKEAHALGATGTHFTNPHGLPDDDHYTTAYDLYLMMNEALKYDEFRKIASTASYTAEVTDSEGNEKNLTWETGNGFMAGKFSLPQGLNVEAAKTGHTNAAGFCLVMGEASDTGDNYISVTMKAGSYDALYNGTTTLLQKINK